MKSEKSQSGLPPQQNHATLMQEFYLERREVWSVKSILTHFTRE